MKVRFVEACVLGTKEFEHNAVHDLPDDTAALALSLRRAVPYVEPVLDADPGDGEGSDVGK